VAEEACSYQPLVGTKFVFLISIIIINGLLDISLTCVKDEDVINDSLLSISLSSSKDYQVLSKLSA